MVFVFFMFMMVLLPLPDPAGDPEHTLAGVLLPEAHPAPGSCLQDPVGTGYCPYGHTNFYY